MFTWALNDNIKWVLFICGDMVTQETCTATVIQAIATYTGLRYPLSQNTRTPLHVPLHESYSSSLSSLSEERDPSLAPEMITSTKNNNIRKRNYGVAFNPIALMMLPLIVEKANMTYHT